MVEADNRSNRLSELIAITGGFAFGPPGIFRTFWPPPRVGLVLMSGTLPET